VTRTCLDLFAGLGGFSSAFEDADGWDVVTVDIQERFNPDIRADVLDLRPSDLPDADVVLASPPCTEFSTMQNLNGGVDPSGDTIALVYHTLGIIHGLAPEYWFLETRSGSFGPLSGDPPRP
jgi:site-specific DNA-cytosine methylase